MSRITLEHVNLTVTDLPATLRFIHLAMPAWRVRGSGQMDWFGKTIDWCHVGDDHSYLALQSGGETEPLTWQSHHTGAKHIGLVVADLSEVLQRLDSAGFALDHWGGKNAARRSAYVLAPGALQFEFVQYDSESVALRNDYV